MNDNFQSEYKDTESVRKYVSKHNIYSLIFALGFFIIIVSIIPYLLIISEKIEDRILPSLIVFLIGLIMVLTGNFSKRKLKEKQANKYTVAASEFIDLEKENIKSAFRKDLIIAILLIVLVPIIYYIIYSNTHMLAENYNKYIKSVLILILALAVFIILYSKGKKEAYSSLI